MLQLHEGPLKGLNTERMDREKHYLKGSKPSTSWSQGMCSTAVLQCQKFGLADSSFGKLQ